MSCTCGGVSIIEGTNPILDVQKVIQDWAWNKFVKRAGSFRRLFLRRDHFEVDVPMNYYEFEDIENKLMEIDSDAVSQYKKLSTSKNDDPKQDMDPISSISTKYVNDTDKPQTYKFRIERNRKATTNVTYQKGFSIGGQARFKVGVFDGSIETKFEITKTEGESFEQSLLFETSSDINVGEKTTCNAIVVFTEIEIRQKFQVKTKMSMPRQSAPIFIRRKKDKKQFALLQLTDLAYVFDPYEKRKEVEYIVEKFPVEESKPERGNYITHVVLFTTTGIIEGSRLSGETVKLQGTKIKPKEKLKLKSVDGEIAEHIDHHHLAVGGTYEK